MRGVATTLMLAALAACAVPPSSAPSVANGPR